MNLPFNYSKLARSFYAHDDVLLIAAGLLGKLLVTRFDGVVTSGRIVETEAYRGVTDKASHAFGNRRTARTEVMYSEGGLAYVYLCYGIHHMFNVVTGVKDQPHAILVRAVEPVDGREHVLARTGRSAMEASVGSGPGNVSKALGIHTRHSGLSLLEDEIFIGDDGKQYQRDEIVATPRIGVDYAGEDAKLPYRFIVKGSQHISARSLTNKFLRS